jgi:rSAM/selenodomain-associated transferase 2
MGPEVYTFPCLEKQDSDMGLDKVPEISLIVPVLNEKNNLPGLFESLRNQTEVFFEAIFCDGGSDDGSMVLLEKHLGNEKFNVSVIRSEKGRGRQMNQGAHHARAQTLLFLHADSTFGDPLALRKAHNALASRVVRLGHEKVAGHFPLRFLRSAARPSMAYHFYESKTRLNRKGCINGDQGFLLRRSFFDEIGGFDESLGFLEDERMAERIFAKGQWFLLPSEIITSARRFETEGLFERQVLNAFIMNFSAIGWDVFFKEAAGIYRTQKESGRLNLLPFFEKIVELLKQESHKRRISLWYQTGAYVNENAWQLAYALDVRGNFRNRRDITENKRSFLEGFDSHWHLLVNHTLGRIVTTALTWTWFHSFRTWMKLKLFFSP